METLQDTTHREFVITRTLNAPRTEVFNAWTDEEQLKQWWGPQGCHLGIEELDVRAGGTFHYYMQFGEGPKIYGKFVYHDVQAPELLVYVNAFSNEAGHITRAPFSETWPEEILNTLTFEEQDGQTVLTLRSKPINVTEEEQKTFEQGIPSMEQGFTGTLDKLAAFLENA